MDRLLSKRTPRSFTLEEKGSTVSGRANEDEEETWPRLYIHTHTQTTWTGKDYTDLYTVNVIGIG